MGVERFLKMDNPPDASDEPFTFTSSSVDAKPTIPPELLGVHVSTSRGGGSDFQILSAGKDGSTSADQDELSLALDDVSQHTTVGGEWDLLL